MNCKYLPIKKHGNADNNCKPDIYLQQGEWRFWDKTS